MVNLNKTFYDKTCDIYVTSVLDKDGTEVPVETMIYEWLTCDYYIAPRWNVVNYLQWAEARKTEKDRFDCVLPWIHHNPANPILKWYTVRLYNEGVLEGNYIIDQASINKMPSGRVENIYLRLNNDS